MAIIKGATSLPRVGEGSAGDKRGKSLTNTRRLRSVRVAGASDPLSTVLTLCQAVDRRCGFQKPLGHAVNGLPSLDYVTVRLKAEDLEGLGYAFTPGHGIRFHPDVLKSAR